jgi:hypothetical protein
LHDLNRAYNKSTAELRTRSKFQGWPERGRVEGLRRSDPLLSYLVNARGADEHGIAQITNSVPGGIGINPAVANFMHIEHMEIRNNQIYVRSPQQLRVDVRPPRIVLVPIVNNARTYPVPSSHEGMALLNSDPATIGELACGFYQRYFDMAETEIFK